MPITLFLMLCSNVSIGGLICDGHLRTTPDTIMVPGCMSCSVNIRQIQDRLSFLNQSGPSAYWRTPPLSQEDMVNGKDRSTSHVPCVPERADTAL